jgi:hypothetical protein
VPVLGIEHDRPRTDGTADLAVDGVDDLVSSSYIERAVGVGEVVLDIDHEQRRALAVRRPTPLRHPSLRRNHDFVTKVTRTFGTSRESNTFGA